MGRFHVYISIQVVILLQVSRADAPDPKTMNPIEEIQTEIEAKLMEAGDHGGATYYEQRDFTKSSCWT